MRLRRALLAVLFAFTVLPAAAAPKERGPAWASLTADQQQVLAVEDGQEPPGVLLLAGGPDPLLDLELQLVHRLIVCVCL